MDPMIQKYLADKYAMNDEERGIVSDSEGRGNTNAFGQGLMEAADTIAAGLSNREKVKPLLSGDPYQSSEKVREYILGKMQARRMAAEDEESRRAAEGAARTKADEQAKKDAKDDRDYKLQLARLGLDRQKLANDKMVADKKAEQEKPATAAKFLAAGFGKRIEAANALMDNLKDKGYDAASAGSGFKRAMPESILGIPVGNAMKSSEDQMQQQAEQNFVTAVLRKESGAAISPTEFAQAEKMYFPRPGDAPAVLEQKRMSRQQALENLRSEASEAWDKIPGQAMVAVDTTKQASGEAIASDGKVKIMAPNGEVRLVDKSSAKKYIEKGGKVVP